MVREENKSTERQFRLIYFRLPACVSKLLGGLLVILPGVGQVVEERGALLCVHRLANMVHHSVTRRDHGRTFQDGALAVKP